MLTLILKLFRGRSPVLLATILAATLAGASFTIYSFTLHQFPPAANAGDSYWVAHGSDTIVDCIEHGILNACDRHHGDPPQPGNPVAKGVGPYPPPQYIVGIVAQKVFGATPVEGTLNWFSRINALAFLALLVLAIRLGIRTGRAWAPPLLVLMVIASPVTYYTNSTLGESLTTLLVAAMAYAALLRKHWAILAITAFFATLTKETVFPFTGAIALTALWVTPLSSRRLMKRDWIAVVVAVACGALFHVAFDYFRYGVLYNADYTNSVFRVDNFTVWWKYTVSVLFAPNGGLLPFWPIASVIVILGGWFGVTALRRDRRDIRRWLPGIMLVAIQIVQAMILGRWWSPFGWIAWGPRLQLSLIPASVFIAVALYGDELQRVIAWFAARNWRRDLVLVGSALAAVPSSAAAFDGTPMGEMWNQIPAGTACSIPVSPPDPHYYACNIWHAWTQAFDQHWILADALRGMTRPTSALGAGAAIVAAAVCAAAILIAAQRAAKTNDSPVSVAAAE